jgi:plasmid stabilization system protein ParE
MTLIVQPEAEADVRQAMQWYDAQRAGLGGEFIAELDRVFALIETSPALFAITYRTTHKVSLRRFPYAVLYLERNFDVIVLGVIHQRRHPRISRARSQ